MSDVDFSHCDSYPYPDSYRDPKGDFIDIPKVKSPPWGVGGGKSLFIDNIHHRKYFYF